MYIWDITDQPSYSQVLWPVIFIIFYPLLAQSRLSPGIRHLTSVASVSVNRVKQGNNNELPLNIEGETVTDFQELAKRFNNYFVNATNLIQSENSDNTSTAAT